MKTKIYLTSEELKGSDFGRFNISIRLDDECNNGHDDFSITGEGWEKGSRRRDCDVCGCVHEEILKLRPDLQPFVDLHLCSSKGAPMYPIENSYYIMTTDTKEKAVNYMRVTSNEYDILKNSGDKLHFWLQLENLGIVDRWQEEANKAIKLLEKMTGEVYTDSSTKETMPRLTAEDRAAIVQKIESGYYSEKEINERKIKAVEDQREKTIQEVKDRAEKEIQKINNEKAVKLAVLSAGVPIDNFIYYDHSNEGVFNWYDSPYAKRVNPEQFTQFMKVVNLAELPNGIKFSLK